MDVRSFLGRLGAGRIANGLKLHQLKKFMENGGISIPYRSLHYWRLKFSKHGSAQPLERRKCERRGLDPCEEMVAVGYVLNENQCKRRVLYCDVRKFIKDEFQVEYSLSWIRNIMLRNGICLHKESTKQPDVRIKEEEAVSQAMQELLILESFGIIDKIKKHPELVVCFDYITDSRRRFQFVSLSGRGNSFFLINNLYMARAAECERKKIFIDFGDASGKQGRWEDNPKHYFHR